jgi:hypothetical protein
MCLGKAIQLGIAQSEQHMAIQRWHSVELRETSTAESHRTIETWDNFISRKTTHEIEK